MAQVAWHITNFTFNTNLFSSYIPIQNVTLHKNNNTVLTLVFQGLWTDGRVSRAMCAAGVSALGGVGVLDGALVLLGRSAVVRIQERDILARAHALFSSDRKIQAINLLCSVQAAEAQTMANDFISYLAERPNLLTNKELAKKVIKLCVTYNLRYLSINSFFV